MGLIPGIGKGKKKGSNLVKHDSLDHAGNKLLQNLASSLNDVSLAYQQLRTDIDAATEGTALAEIFSSFSGTVMHEWRTFSMQSATNSILENIRLKYASGLQTLMQSTIECTIVARSGDMMKLQDSNQRLFVAAEELKFVYQSMQLSFPAQYNLTLQF